MDPWVEYSKITRPDDYKEHGLMFEMYGFSLASLDIGLHPIAGSYMVSNVDVNNEAWKNATFDFENHPTVM